MDFLHTLGAKVVAGISGILLLFSGAHVVTHSHPSTQTAAAVVATQEISQTSGASTSTSSTHSTSSVQASSPQATVVNQYITQPVIEHAVQAAATPSTGYVTQDAFTSAINALNDKFGKIIYGTTYPAPATNYGSGGVFNSISLSNKIDQLTNTTITNATVHGLAGLTSADIPTNITAINYLPLAGGTMTGALNLPTINLSQNLTVSGGTIMGVRSLTPSFASPSAYRTLKAVADSDLLANKSNFNDGTHGWIAAVGTYGNLFVADFWLAASQYPDYFTPAQIYNVYHKFISAKDINGNLPISILPTTGAGTDYYSGLDNVHAHTTGDPIWLLPLLMKQYYTATGDTTNFSSDLSVLDAALKSVPRNSTTHLVSAGTTPSTLWITFGFQDGVQKSGDDLIGSLFYYQAASAMAQMYTAIGDTSNAAAYNADATLIATNIGTLFNPTDGMFHAATGQDNQIDINGSAMAVYLGLTTDSQTAAISSYLSTNQGTLFNVSGYVRQSPTNWSSAWSGSSYDNGYWSWGNFWVLDAIRRNSPSTAVALATTFANASNNTHEYFSGNTPSGAVTNLETPMGVLRFIHDNAGLFPQLDAAPSPSLQFDLSGNTLINGALYLPGKGLIVGANTATADPGVGNAYFAGNVGIGTTSPTVPLVIDSTSTNGSILRLSNSSTGGHIFDLLSTGSGNTGGAGRLDIFDYTLGLPRLSIASNGNVGIGTTNPGSKLEVQGTATAQVFNATSTTATSTFAGGFAVNTSGLVYDGSTHLVGINTVLPQQELTVAGAIQSIGASSNANQTGAQFDYNGTSARLFGYNSAGSNILFYANALGGNVAERMRVTGAGNIGIGTASPSYLLDVAGLGHFTGLVDAPNFVATSTSATSIFAGGLTVGTSQLVVQHSTGNVGIGTTTPYGILSISNSATTPGATPLFVIASTTAGTATTTLFSVGNTGTITIGATSNFLWAGSSVLSSPSDGKIEMSNNAQTGFTLLQFGGTTNVFPAIKRVNATLQARFADDSDLVSFRASNYSLYNGSNLADAADGILLLRNSTGSDFTRIDFGGTSSAFPALGRSGANLVIESADGSMNANLGIGTSSPDMLLAVGSATPVGNVAHFENSTGSCYINPTTGVSCSSDSRLKTNINTLTASSGIAALMQLSPVTYNWTAEATGTPTHSGFIAQQVQPILPDLVSQGPDGYYTLNYAGFVPYLVKAVQELAAQINTLANTVAGFAESITTKILTAAEGHFKNKLCVGKSDGGEVCITGDQLAAAVSGQASAGGGAASAASGSASADASASSIPPTIEVTGNNPATVNVGDTYSDLGAKITGPTADLNLGIHTFVGTTPMEFAVIDTRAPATYHLYYVATDQNGLTSTSTRTVIVQAATSTSSGSTTTTDTAATTTADASTTSQ